MLISFARTLRTTSVLLTLYVAMARCSAADQSSPNDESTFESAAQHGVSLDGLTAFVFSPGQDVEITRAVPLFFGLLVPEQSTSDARKVMPPDLATTENSQSWFYVSGPNSRPIPYGELSMCWRFHDPSNAVWLHPGEIRGRKQSRLGHPFSEIGTYHISWHYRFQGHEGTWAGRLESNMLRLVCDAGQVAENPNARSASPDVTPEKAGVSAFLFCPRQTFRVGQPIPVFYGILVSDDENVENVKIWPPRLACDENNYSWFSVVGPDGKERPFLGPYVEWPRYDPKTMVRLGSGEFHGRHCANLIGYHRFDEPGPYNVQWHYDVRGEEGAWQGKLQSNAIEINVTR